MQPELST
ncbi:hypothetical protein vseg_000712 [Gypsophila vaccaria]